MLEKIVIISLLVIAIWATMLPTMILGFLGNWIVDKFPEWISKPVCDCVVCMVPYYGSALYWLIWGNSGKEWGIVVISAMGLNVVFAISTKLIKTE